MITSCFASRAGNAIEIIFFRVGNAPLQAILQRKKEMKLNCVTIIRGTIKARCSNNVFFCLVYERVATKSSRNE